MTMKKVTIFAVMLAMVLVLAVPAVADQGGGPNNSCHGRTVGLFSQNGATPGQIQKDGGWTASDWNRSWKDVC
jgi:hypothetical protein